MLSYKNDPETEQHCVKKSLSDIDKKLHPGQIHKNAEEFKWNVHNPH